MASLFDGNDYPPFNYAGSDGQPSGFNVDLARAICEEIKVQCTIQARRFDTRWMRSTAMAVMPSSPRLRSRRPCAAGSISATPTIEPGALRIPQGRRDRERSVPTSNARRSRSWPAPHMKPISARFSPRRTSNLSKQRRGAGGALKRGEVDLVFDDGISLSFWLNGTGQRRLLRIPWRPFLESRYFGEGVGIAVRRGNELMRLAVNWALFASGRMANSPICGCAYFPISPF